MVVVEAELMESSGTQSLLSLINSMQSGDLPIEEYLAQLRDRFVDREPIISAFLPEEDRFGRLQLEAETNYDKYPQPANRPSLFGVPIGVKDIFHVDGFDTRAGSRLPAEVLRGRQARTVSAMKDAGALVMGKTETTEFAYFAPGPTRNPRNPSHTPGGSSSGSAAAVAAGLCPVALGTQTIGSVIRPAAFCGIVGFKPSYDRVSRSGIIPLSPSLDHVGLFAETIAGVDLAAGLLCPDWHLAVAEGLPVLGIPEGPYLEKTSDPGMIHFRATCARLSEAGCTLKPVSLMTDFEDVVGRHNLIVAAEAAQVHAHWFAEYGDLYHEKTVELIRRGREISVGELAEALTGRQKLRHQITENMDRHGIDLWISPSAAGPAPPGLESTGDPVMNLPWTHSGLPTVNLPSGEDENGMPFGLQVTGRWYEDEALLEWSAELETIVCPVA